MRTKKYINKPVTLCRMTPEGLEKVQGIHRGYLGKNLLLDTGTGLFEQYVIGTAPGRYLVFPAKIQIDRNENLEPEPVIKKKMKIDEFDDVLIPEWDRDVSDLSLSSYEREDEYLPQGFSSRQRYDEAVELY